MEYVNINSVQNQCFDTLLATTDLENLNASKIAPGYVVTTDTLELLDGEDLIEDALAKGIDILPLRRQAFTRATQNFPKRVLLELTTHCNSLCTMCPRNVLTRKMQHMDTHLAKDVIAQLAEVGISGLWLYNIGESLMHPDIFEILEYCAQFDSLGTIWLSTNGEIVSDEIADKILRAPIDILNFSINAMSEENYVKIAPQLHYQVVRNNLDALLKKKQELGALRPLIRVQMIKLPHVLHEVDAFIKTYGNRADIISINEWEIFSQNVNVSDEKQKNEYIARCNRLEREDFFIFSDGSVSCCDTDFNCTLNLGNVKDQTIQEIFDGEVYKGLLTKYKEGHLHEVALCAYCKDFDL